MLCEEGGMEGRKEGKRMGWGERGERDLVLILAIGGGLAGRWMS
jgi:hypothetical protein